MKNEIFKTKFWKFLVSENLFKKFDDYNSDYGSDIPSDSTTLCHDYPVQSTGICKEMVIKLAEKNNIAGVVLKVRETVLVKSSVSQIHFTLKRAKRL